MELPEEGEYAEAKGMILGGTELAEARESEHAKGDVEWLFWHIKPIGSLKQRRPVSLFGNR